MSIRAQLADGRILEFPDGTDPNVIQAAVKRLLGQDAQPQGVDIDVPTEENLALEQQRAVQEQARQAQIPLSEKALGVGEALLTTGTGATTGAAGFGVGSLIGAAGELTGLLEEGEGEQLASEFADALTYSPRTETGQEITQELADALSVLPPVLGSAPITPIRAGQLASRPVKITAKSTKDAIKNTSDVIRSLGAIKDPATINQLQEILPDQIKKTPRAKRAVIAEMVRADSPNVDNVTKMLSDTGELVTNKTSKRALKVLSRDFGDDKAAQTVSVIENMTPATKKRLNDMLDIIQRGEKEPLFKQENRPSDVLGNAVADRARAIARINKNESKKIGDIASRTNKVVDIQRPATDFFNGLRELGVTFSRGEDGWITPDFSRSKFIGGSQKDMAVLINDLANPQKQFKAAHDLKRTIRDNIDFDAVGPGQIKGESQNLLKKLSSGIDDILDSESPQYRSANEKFAKTVGLRDRFSKLTGREINIFDDAADKSLGPKARRIVSNAQSRAEIMELLRDAESTLGDLGVNFKDDISGLNHAVTQLEQAFKIEPPGSFQGRIQRAGVNLAQGISPKTAATEAILEKVTSINKPDFNKKMRAFRSLANQGNK